MNASESEKKSIMKTLQYFWDGFDNLDAELLKKAFHPNAFLYMNLESIPATDWADNFTLFLKSKPEDRFHQEKYEKELIMLDVTDNVAVAKVEYRSSYLIMTDYYTLLRIDNTWYITSKVWNDNKDITK